MINVIQGDAIAYAKEHGNFLIHGANCFCTMGAGIALHIANHFPEAFEADCETVAGDDLKLGTITTAFIDEYKLTVVNAYTQYNPGPCAQLVAIRCALKEVRNLVTSKAQEIVMPMIGCGIGGLHWNQVKEVVEQELGDYNVTVCFL